MLAAGLYEISTDLKSTPNDVALLSGYNLLTTGAFLPIVSILSRKYGKRPIYLFLSTIAIVAIAIGEAANSYHTLLASRVIHGLATSAYESIVMASIGDLFFVHEVNNVSF